MATKKNPDYFLRLTNGIIDPLSGRFTPSDEYSRFEGKQLWYAYDPAAKCDRWLEFLAKFPNLDVQVLQTFFRKCACPVVTSRLLVAIVDDDLAEDNLSNILKIMFTQIVPLDQTAISTKKSFKQLKRESRSPIVQLQGCPKTVEEAVAFRRTLEHSRVRAILFTQKEPEPHMPPHSVADFRVNSPVEVYWGMFMEFLSERPGMLNWSLKHTQAKH